MSKKIILTEAQEKEFIRFMITEKTYPVEPTKVLRVKEFLDKNFKRGSLTGLGNNGFPKNTPVVGMISNKEVVKNLTAEQLLYLLEDEFRGMFDDKEKLKRFLKQVMKHWYYKNISKEGLLTITNY